MGKGKFTFGNLPGATFFKYDIKDITFIYKALLASNAVCKIVKNTGEELGTGFLISPNLILTNNHVISSSTQNNLIVFFENNYSIENGNMRLTTPIEERTISFDVFLTDPKLDFTIVAINKPINFEFIILGRNNPNKECLIIHYPRVDSKSITLNSIKIVGDIPKQISDFCKHNFWYESDTASGSSGSPLFDSDWNLIGLHHGFLPKYVDKNGKYEFIKIDGSKVCVKDYYSNGYVYDEKDFVQIANEGTKIIDIIVKILDQIKQTKTDYLKELKGIIDGKLPHDYDTLKDTSIAINKIKKSLII